MTNTLLIYSMIIYHFLTITQPTREHLNIQQSSIKIPSKLFRVTVHYIHTPLTHIINLCFQQGCFPNKLRSAKVIPILKPGNDDHENSYILISILPSISKEFEKRLFTDLKNFLKSSTYYLKINAVTVIIRLLRNNY